MTPKQEQFVREYLIDLNATQAAIRAGYSERTAYSAGQRLLKNVEVAAALVDAKADRAEAVGIDAQYVLRQAVKLHERCMQEIEPLTDRKGEQVMVKTEDGELAKAFVFNAAGAAKALELVGKHVGVQAFKEQFEHSGNLTLGAALDQLDR